MRLPRLAPAVGCALLLVWGAPRIARAQKAPEHPEHPEHPSEKKKISVDSVEKTIKEKIAAKAKEDGGTFKLKDDVLNKTWSLELIKVHRDKLTRLEDGTYFACVDMAEVGSKNVVDVDFFLKEKNGDLVFEDMAVHKVNGTPRYNWEKQGDAWVKKPVTKS
jgi:hypothetical protein